MKQIQPCQSVHIAYLQVLLSLVLLSAGCTGPVYMRSDRLDPNLHGTLRSVTIVRSPQAPPIEASDQTAESVGASLGIIPAVVGSLVSSSKSRSASAKIADVAKDNERMYDLLLTSIADALVAQGYQTSFISPAAKKIDSFVNPKVLLESRVDSDLILDLNVPFNGYLKTTFPGGWLVKAITAGKIPFVPLLATDFRVLDNLVRTNLLQQQVLSLEAPGFDALVESQHFMTADDLGAHLELVRTNLQHAAKFVGAKIAKSLETHCSRVYLFRKSPIDRVTYLPYGGVIIQPFSCKIDGETIDLPCDYCYYRSLSAGSHSIEITYTGAANDLFGKPQGAPPGKLELRIEDGRDNFVEWDSGIENRSGFIRIKELSESEGRQRISTFKKASPTILTTTATTPSRR